MGRRKIHRRPGRRHLFGHPSVPIATRVSEDVRRLVDGIVARRGADATVADYLRELIEADLVARGWDLRKAGPLPCATLLHVAPPLADEDRYVRLEGGTLDVGGIAPEDRAAWIEAVGPDVEVRFIDG